MSQADPKIDRLLRSAAQGNEDVSPAVPFGFDTRVVALWRAERGEFQRPGPIASPGRAHGCECDRGFFGGCALRDQPGTRHGRTICQRIRDRGQRDSKRISPMNRALQWKLVAGFVLVFVAGMQLALRFGASHTRRRVSVRIGMPGRTHAALDLGMTST